VPTMNSLPPCAAGRRFIVPTSLAVVSAGAATIHEVVWGRTLGRAVGNTAWGIGLALAIFMLGMGAGAILARRILRNGVQPRTAYVLSEFAIAVGSLVSLWLLQLAPISAVVLPGCGDRLRFGFDLAFAVAAVLVPALGIGATFPCLVASVVDREELRGFVTLAYRSGLAGGIAGVLLAATFLVPRTGFATTQWCAAALNVATALVAWWRLSPRLSGIARQARSPAVGPLNSALLLFAVAGVTGLAAQAVWNRVVLPYAGVSTFTFAAIVAIYLAAQYAGMTLASKLRTDPLIRIAYWCMAVSSTLALLTFGLLSVAQVPAPTAATEPIRWLLSTLLLTAVVVGPPALALGAVQAGALRLIEESGGEWAEAAAWVSGMGTACSGLGAAVASLLLVPALGPRGTLVALAALAAVALVVLRQRWLAVVAISFAAVAMWAPGPRYFLGSQFDAAPVLYSAHDIQDTVGIVLRDTPLEPRIRRVVANGVSYSGDSFGAQRYMRLLGHLPALAASGERRALVICVGTGTTAAALRSYHFTEIDAVDVSPSTRTTLGFFLHVNAGLMEDRRVRFHVADGDRFLRLTRSRYDVITLEPPPPSAPGASLLYSREFYRIARAKMSTGGAIAQWLPMHDLSGSDARSIIGTFLDEFPGATLYFAERNEAVLVGRTDGVAPSASDPRRLDSPMVRADLERIGLGGADPLVETLAAGAQALALTSAKAKRITAAWPGPEMMIVGGTQRREHLDVLASDLARASQFASSATSGGTLLRSLAAFVRVREGRGRNDDKATVARELTQLLRRDPSNSHAQYVFGYGPALEERVRRLGSEGLPAPSAAAMRAKFEESRRHAATAAALPLGN